MWCKGLGESLNMGLEENLQVSKKKKIPYKEIFDKFLVFDLLIHVFFQKIMVHTSLYF